MRYKAINSKHRNSFLFIYFMFYLELQRINYEIISKTVGI